jgi:hypothetical protein
MEQETEDHRQPLSLCKYLPLYPVTMMSTVEYLWAQKDDKEDRLSQAEIVIDNLNKEILELGVSL